VIFSYGSPSKLVQNVHFNGIAKDGFTEVSLSRKQNRVRETEGTSNSKVLKQEHPSLI
jgi:hypothetical protein